MSETEGPTKRMASEEIDMEASHKRPRNNGQNVEVRFLLQSKNAGAIIGKGGHNINRLRQDFKASVTVPDCPGPERILSIGIDVESLPDILLDILPKLEEFENNDQDMAEGHCELRMLLHQSHAGCIIGKGGAQIKEIREKTGAHIKVYSNVCPSSTERVVQISGDVKVIVNCVAEIVDLTLQSPIKGPLSLYDPHNYDSFYAREYGGYSDSSRAGGPGVNQRWGPFTPRLSAAPLRSSNIRIPPPFLGGGRPLSGPRGSLPPPPGVRSWTASPARPTPDSPRPPPASWRTSVRGEGGQYSSNLSPPSAPNSGRAPNNYPFTRFPFSKPPADTYNYGAMNSPSTSSTMGDSIFGTPIQPYAPDAFQSGQFGTLFSSKPMLNGDKQGSSQVTIPNELAGAIIGKGGQRIRKIRRESGAGITIDESQPGSNERVITISGTPQQIQMAQYLLQQNVREHSGRKF